MWLCNCRLEFFLVFLSRLQQPRRPPGSIFTERARLVASLGYFRFLHLSPLWNNSRRETGTKALCFFVSDRSTQTLILVKISMTTSNFFPFWLLVILATYYPCNYFCFASFPNVFFPPTVGGGKKRMKAKKCAIWWAGGFCCQRVLHLWDGWKQFPLYILYCFPHGATAADCDPHS